MVKKLLILLVMAFGLFTPFILAYDLSDFPDFIDKNNALLVVGDDASPLDVASGSDYVAPSSGLVNYNECKGVADCILELANSATSYAKDVSNIYNQDIITIGGPCANSVTAKIMELPTTWPECASGFEEGRGRIILYNKWNKTQLVIAGYTAEDTIKVAEELERHGSRMRGKELEVDSKRTFNVVLGEEEKYCTKDDDCVLTQDGCCGCNNLLAVNKKFDGMYKGNCEGIACIAIACVIQTSYAKCINKMCTIVQHNNSIEYDPEMFEAYNNQTWLPVLVRLRNNSDIDNFLESISENDFNGERGDSSIAFVGFINKNGLITLLKDSRVKKISWTKYGVQATIGNDSKSGNLSEKENCILVRNKNIFYSALEEMKFDRTGNPLFVVVGDDQNMEDIKSSFNIANYLMNRLGVESIVKLAKEVTDLDFFNGNIVSVGSPCVNSISAKMIGNQTECTEGFNEGKGKIIFFRNNNYIQLMVAGYSSRDTLTTANAFTSFPLNYSIDKVFSANPEFVLNTSSNFMSFRGCVNYNSSENVIFESLYENFDVIPLIRECPKRKSIDCMPSVPPFDRKFCHAKNSEWLKNNCNVSFSS